MFEVSERNGLLVLTTNQLAEAYETESQIVTNNFSRNKSKFAEGVHYFILKGEELKAYKGSHQNDVTLKFTSRLYLWTEQGAFLLAKSLNTDKAWQAYNLLVSEYYKVKQHLQQHKQEQPLAITHEQFLQLEGRVAELEKALQEVTLHSGEQRRLQRAIGERVYSLTDQKGARQVLFRALYSAIKERYSVGSYRDVRQRDLQDALRFVAMWGGAAHEKRA